MAQTITGGDLTQFHPQPTAFFQSTGWWAMICECDIKTQYCPHHPSQADELQEEGNNKREFDRSAPWISLPS